MWKQGKTRRTEESIGTCTTAEILPVPHWVHGCIFKGPMSDVVQGRVMVWYALKAESGEAPTPAACCRVLLVALPNFSCIGGFIAPCETELHFSSKLGTRLQDPLQNIHEVWRESRKSFWVVADKTAEDTRSLSLANGSIEAKIFFLHVSVCKI